VAHRIAIYVKHPSGRFRDKKEAAPAGGESGRRAHGPTLGGEAGPVLLRAYLLRAHESTPCSLSIWN